MNSSKSTSALAIAILLLIVISCTSLFAKPSGTVKNFYLKIEAGELDAAIGMLSRSSPMTMLGPDKLKAALAQQTAQIRKKQGISSIKIQDEQVKGETAVVKGTVNFKNGTSDDFETSLVKEDGVWKIVK